MTNVLVVEGNGLLRDGLVVLLGQAENIEVVGSADCAESAMEVLQDTPNVDVVLTSLYFQEIPAFDFIRWCKTNYTHIDIILLAKKYDHDLVRSALLIGVVGFVLKESCLEDLLIAIRSTGTGSAYLPQVIYKLLVAGYLKTGSQKSARRMRKNDGLLTQKEQEVLVLVAEGRTNKQISKTQGVGVKTIEKHRGSLMRKLGLKNSAQVARYAVSHGLLAGMERMDFDETGRELNPQEHTVVDDSASENSSDLDETLPHSQQAG